MRNKLVYYGNVLRYRNFRHFRLEKKYYQLSKMYWLRVMESEVEIDESGEPSSKWKESWNTKVDPILHDSNLERKGPAVFKRKRIL